MLACRWWHVSVKLGVVIASVVVGRQGTNVQLIVIRVLALPFAITVPVQDSKKGGI